MITDSLIMSFVIYLMGEHNNDEYIKIYDIICCNCNKYKLPITSTQLQSVASKSKSNSNSTVTEKKTEERKDTTPDNARMNSYGEFSITVKMQHTNSYIDDESMVKILNEYFGDYQITFIFIQY